MATTSALSSDALARFFAHDIRVPLGPTTLALDCIIEDPTSPEEVRQLAAIASAQISRMKRFLDSIVILTREHMRPGPPSEFDLGIEVMKAAQEFESLGGTCEAHLGNVSAIGDRDDFVEGLLLALEALAGENGVASIAVSHERGRAHTAVRCQSTHGPSSETRELLMMAARRLFERNDGGLDHESGGVSLWLPSPT